MDQITPGMTYGLAALSVAPSAIPLLVLIWQVVKALSGSRVPLLCFLGLIVLLHGASELIGTDGWTGLIYILAGVR